MNEIVNEKPETGTEISVKDEETAFEKVKKGLHSVKVSKHDATAYERQLQGELFDKWTEGCEVTKARRIPVDNISAYLNHMQEAYEGITPEIRKKMDGILFAEDWEYKVVEWKFNKDDNSGARYGMMAFGRSRDGKFIDSMYVMYKMDFKVAAQRIVTTKQHSFFWGLIKWTCDPTVEHVKRDLGMKSIKVLQNFFRLRALEGFYKEGLIDSINYVSSLDDVPETPAN